MLTSDLSKFTNTELDTNGLLWFDPRVQPIRLTGLAFAKENGNYHRLPDRLADYYSEGVRMLARNTAGVSLRFRSDSGQIGFRVIAADVDDDTNMSRNGKMAFDVYIGTGTAQKLAGVLHAPRTGLSYDGVISLPSGMKDVTVNFPLYASVEKLVIALENGAELLPPTPFPVPLPVCFYGSSITQGGSAERPGTCYQAMLSRALGFEVMNFGFSGNAKGEILLADLIASVPQAAFVMSYNHNAPDPAYLAKTHEAFFLRFREKQPDVPVIFVSHADTDRWTAWREFRAVIERTYANAVAAGDRNVRFVDGSRIYGTVLRDACTVDGCHPNELGFYRISETLCPILRELLYP